MHIKNLVQELTKLNQTKLTRLTKLNRQYKKHYQSGNKISNTNVKFKFKSVVMWVTGRQISPRWTNKLLYFIRDRFESNPLILWE